MALSDTFETLADGDPLSDDANWDVSLASGSGVPTMDQHDDHSDGSQVVDMSTIGDAYCIYQTQVGAADHFAECDSFIDKGDSHENYVGPIVRGSASSYSGSFDGYGAWFYATGTTLNEIILGIFRIDDGTPTELVNTGDIGGLTTGGGLYSTDEDHVVRLEVSGSTLTAYVNGVEELSTTDATYSSGQWTGFRLFREEATVASQPFVDNWAADTVGEGTPEGTASASLALTASGQGDVEYSGSASASVTLTATAQGDVDYSGTASTSIDLTATAQGFIEYAGTATADLAFAASAAGEFVTFDPANLVAAVDGSDVTLTWDV